MSQKDKASSTSVSEIRDYDMVNSLIIASRYFTTLIIQHTEVRCAMNNSRQFDWIKVNYYVHSGLGIDPLRPSLYR